MKHRRLLLGLVVLSIGACAPSAAPPPKIGSDQAITVFPPNNGTGDPLLVVGASALDRYAFHAAPVSVGDVLAGEARFQLDERGFRVTPHERVAAALQGRTPRNAVTAAEIAAKAGLGGLVLFLEIRRWEPDAAVHPSFVIVGLSASLVDTSSGKITWQFDRPAVPVATPGEVTVENAYETAARKVIAEVVSALGSPAQS